MRITRPVLPALLVVARVAAIETTAPLADHSEDSIKAALKQAVLTAVAAANRRPSDRTGRSAR